MSSTQDAFHQLAGEVAGVLAFDDVRRLGDEALLEAMAAVEELGRRVDALRAATAGQVVARSRSELGSDGLACKKGCRSPKELVERVTLVSGSSATRRMRLGSGTAIEVGLTGQDRPAPFPTVADALTAGTLGADAAEVIVEQLSKLLPRVACETVQAAESELVAAATGTSPEGGLPAGAEELKLLTSVWVAYLDPDGVEPAEAKALARRGIRLGALRDGVIPISGALMPEIAAKLKRLFDAYMSRRTGPAFLAKIEDAEQGRAGEEAGSEPGRDGRTPDQQRHDVLAGILDFAARSAEAPLIGGAPPTVLVSVRKEDLEAGTGAGWADGLEAPVSMTTVRRLTCAGGIQPVILDPGGRVIALGVEQRCFTAQQRRAISMRDGGCLTPGCSIPAGWCEIHHVEEASHGGPTDTDNGVLLCWFHHHTIDASGWRIRMHAGSPRIKAPPWLEPNGPWRPATKSRTRLTDQLRRPVKLSS